MTDLRQKIERAILDALGWDDGFDTDKAVEAILALIAERGPVMPEEPSEVVIDAAMKAAAGWIEPSETQARGIIYAIRAALAKEQGVSEDRRKSSANDHTSAERDVIAERRRQLCVEGWTKEHDNKHVDGELARAAASYALGSPGLAWPWGLDWWKPTNRRRDLVKAAALIIAEIERIDRAALANEQGR